MADEAAPNWYPDPLGRYDYRYWDGSRWTDQVATGGVQTQDPPTGYQQVAAGGSGNSKIAKQVRQAGVTTSGGAGGGTIFTESVLVINQKAKVFEVKAEYAVFNQHGHRIGTVRQVGETMLKKAVSPRPDARRKLRFEILDQSGNVLLTLTRPANYAKSKVIVKDSSRRTIGEIAQKNTGVFGKYRFDIEAEGRRIGTLKADDWDAWDFALEDRKGAEIGRISKTWAGAAKEWFTKGDHYVIELDDGLDEAVRRLAVATAVTVDTVIKQRGGSGRRRQ